MDHGREVGVLLPAPVLRRIVGQRSSWESGAAYAEAAEAHGMRAVLFGLRGYDPQRARVRGYVRSGGRWRLYRGPLPTVVHNRVVPVTLGVYYLLRWLARHVAVFNPPMRPDLWQAWERLSGSPELKAHVPDHWRLRRGSHARLIQWARARGGAEIRPRFRSSLSCRITPMPGRRYRWTGLGRRSRTVTQTTLIRLVRRLLSKGSLIAHARIDLAEHGSQRLKLRLPVQRDGRGEWRVPARTAGRAPVEWLAKRRSNHQGTDPVQAVFGQRRGDVVRGLAHRLCLGAAAQLAEMEPTLADLVLIIGVDRSAKPWILDVRYRDRRRSPGEGENEYRNPIAYARFLLDRSPQGPGR